MNIINVLNPWATKEGGVDPIPLRFLHHTLTAYGINFNHFR